MCDSSTYYINNERDFEQFFRKHYEQYLFFAMRFITDDEACRDVVSDCFEYIWNHYHDQRITNWRTYGFSFIRSQCLDIIRHSAVHDRYRDFFLNDNSEIDEEYRDWDDERTKMVMQAMEELTPRTREVLTACYLQKKKYKEVAEELDISTSTVKMHIMKALKILREKCNDNGALFAILNVLLLNNQ